MLLVNYDLTTGINIPVVPSVVVAVGNVVEEIWAKIFARKRTAKYRSPNRVISLE